jgi:hypothetical protein
MPVPTNALSAAADTGWASKAHQPHWPASKSAKALIINRFETRLMVGAVFLQAKN